MHDYFFAKVDENRLFCAKYHVYGMRITCKRYCGVVKNAVPLPTNSFIINFLKGKDYE